MAGTGWPREMQRQPTLTHRGTDRSPALPNYRPVFLKYPFLGLFFLYLCGIVAVSEWACRRLPVSQGYQTVPDGPTPDGRGVFFSAPLLAVRPTGPAYASRPATLTTTTTTPRPTTRARSIRALKSRQNSTLYSNDTSLRDPVSFDGRTGYGPEWLEVLAPNFTQSLATFWKGLEEAAAANSSEANLNQTGTETGNSSSSSSLRRKRHPGKASYATLENPAAYIQLIYTFDQFYSGPNPPLESLFFTWLRPSIVLQPEYASCIPPMSWESGWGTAAQGLVACVGGDFVFQNEACYASWMQATAHGSEIVKRMPKDSVTILDLENALLDRGWGEADAPRRCDGPLLGCNARKDPTCGGQFDLGAGAPGADTAVDGDGGGDVEGKETSPPDGETAITMRDENGIVTAVVTAQVFYQRNPQGVITATSTRLKTPSGVTGAPLHPTGATATAQGQKIPTKTTMTLRGPDGVATATITAGLPVDALETITLTDSNGVPTATITRRPPPPPSSTSGGTGPSFPTGSDEGGFHLVSPNEYWTISLLPVFLAVLTSLFADAISASLSALHPLRELTRAGGVASHTLLSSPGLFDLRRRLREPVIVLSDLLVACNAVVTALSSEAVGIKLAGSCREDDSRGCYMGVAIFLAPMRIVQALLCVSLPLLVGLAVLLWGWRSGAVTAPGSITSVGALMRDADLRELLARGVVVGPDGGVDTSSLEGYRFSLGYYHVGEVWLTRVYGITAHRVRSATGLSDLAGVKGAQWLKRTRTALSAATTSGLTRTATWMRKAKSTTKPHLLITTTSLLYHAGLLILVTYYSATENPNTPFEKFLNSQDFGVRLLFTVLGILLTYFWDYYYALAAVKEPYRRLSRAPYPTHKILTDPRPISPFVGIVTSLKRGEYFLSVVAFTDIVSKFIPILLSNVPFSPVQTWEMFLLCAWMTVGCLAGMMLVLVYGCVWVRYPDFPVDPEGVLGQMVYLCDSRVLDGILEEDRGMRRRDSTSSDGSDGNRKDGGRIALERGRGEKRYRFGDMVGVSGMARTGIDFAPGCKADGDDDAIKGEWMV